jgi:hypothetical protein
MSDNLSANLNPVVYDTENEPGTSDSVREQIFRPNTDNGNNAGLDTAESRIMTPASDVNYHSMNNRTQRRDAVEHTREVESLRNIIERLDQGDEGTGPDTATMSNGADESELRSVMTEEFNEVLSRMRVDMVSIIKLLQTLHSKITDQATETDNIKEDIYNLVLAVGKIKDKIEEVNTSTIRRHQKYSGKVDDQISKICVRLEALERANFSTSEPVRRETPTSARTASKDVAQTNRPRANKRKEPSPHSTQEIFDAQGSLRRQNIRVRPKRTSKSTKDHVGNNNVGPSSYNTSSRIASRAGKYEDTVDKASIKTSKMASRGLKDSVIKTTRKPRNDVIQSHSSKKTGSRDEGDNEEINDDFSSDEPIDTDDQDDQTDDTEENGKNIQVFKS